MSRFQRIRKAVNQTAFWIVVAQILAMIGLTIRESFLKKRRGISSGFPTSSPKPVAVRDDNVAVYTYGEDLYEDMEAAIDAARERVYFETYIWKSDVWGQRIKDALIRAADRGVEVYVVWDTFGNIVVGPRFFRFPKHVHTLRFPIIRGVLGPTKWGLDHRKLMVVDGEVGFIGGYNIGDLYATGWRDTHARVTGPGVAELENAFIDFWNLHYRKGSAPIDRNPERSWFGPMRIHRNTPRLSVYPIRNMYLEAIDRSQHHIWMTHAYLIPDAGLVGTLRQAVARGVDVRFIIPERSNHIVADWMARGHYTQLLHSGVRLFLYQGAMVHAKTATSDGAWSTIGTANLDRLSLVGNYEINLEVIDEPLAEHMEQIFRMDLGNCYELTLDEWQQRGWISKLTEWFLSPWAQVF